jgi:hypothetical protein
MMTHRRAVHETMQVAVETATNAPGVLSVDLRVFFPPDLPRPVVAGAVEELVARVLREVCAGRVPETVDLPELAGHPGEGRSDAATERP